MQLRGPFLAYCPQTACKTAFSGLISDCAAVQYYAAQSEMSSTVQCPLSSTDKHRACEGDIVSAVFIILDLNEKSGWTERNAKREFYAHAHTIVGSEKSLRHALDIIRKTLAEEAAMVPIQVV